MWGCKAHWFKMPAVIRWRLLGTYVPGQEIRKDPSEDYLDAAREARDWIREQNRKERVFREGKTP